MKNLKHKKALGFVGLGLGVVLLSSCTANFCSQKDQAAMAYPYDQGATVYVSKAEYETLKTADATKDLIAQEEAWSDLAVAQGLPRIAGPAFNDASINDRVYKYIPFKGYGDKLELTANKTAGFLKGFLSDAKTAGYSIPSVYYYAVMDDYVLKAATVEYINVEVKNNTSFVFDANNDTFESVRVSSADFIKEIYAGSEELPASYVAVNPYFEVDPAEKAAEIPTKQSVLRGHGKVRFGGAYDNTKKDYTFLGNQQVWTEAIRTKVAELPSAFTLFTSYDLPGLDYWNFYKGRISAKVNTVRSCIATRDGEYGHYGSNADWRVAIENKDWGYAWGRGFLEGLIVYPVTWVLDSLAFSFDPALSGMGQIWALVIVTLIVRGLLLALSWRTTMDNQKMQALQPELARLQQKYPNAQTNMAEKQRMSQEQMMLYRRHGIKPFRQILIMIVQFPVFICVWAGLQGSAALSTGEIIGMRLSDNINAILFDTTKWWVNDHGWWTAFVLFILMAATQVMAMLLPRILAKRASKGVAKTAKAQQNNTMKIVSYGLIIFTIIMGFFLPSAMGVYWLIGGLISMAQTLITQAIMAKSKKGTK